MASWVHRPTVLWFTGRPSAGKSTIASLVTAALHERRVPAVTIDGDVLRAGASADLGFSPGDRVEQARRAAGLALAAVGDGAIAIVAVISPSVASREAARAVLGAAMVEIYVDAPLSVCMTRDVKGLYAKACRGEISDFTGISSPYERPTDPALRLDTTRETPTASAERVLNLLAKRTAPILSPTPVGDTGRPRAGRFLRRRDRVEP